MKQTIRGDLGMRLHCNTCGDDRYFVCLLDPRLLAYRLVCRECRVELGSPEDLTAAVVDEFINECSRKKETE